MSKTLISVVMPVYNGEKYLRESIESVIAQTYIDWEMILVDDCSTDSSYQIMQEYQQKYENIHIVQNEHNKGISESLNAGFEQAIGEYYTWTSDDNRYLTTAFEKMAVYLDGHKEEELVYADMYQINCDGDRTGKADQNIDLFFGDCVGACFMYRAERAHEISGYDQSWSLIQDYEYWLRLCRKGAFAHLPKKLYEYRVHAQSLTSNNEKEMAEECYALRIGRLNYILENISEEYRDILFMDMYFMHKEDINEYLLKFYSNGNIPDHVHWCLKERQLDPDKKIIIFGAGKYGRKALELIGEEKVEYYVDNDIMLEGKKYCGKEILSYQQYVNIYQQYQLVIAVKAKYVIDIAKQLRKQGITDFVTYLELRNERWKRI